jgi:hypothetical protein
MSRVNAGWIVGIGTLVIPSCATHVTFRDHRHAAGAAGAAAGGDSGNAGRGGAGDAMGGSSQLGGGTPGGAPNGGSSAQNGGGSPQMTGGKSSAGGASGRNPSTAGVENTNGGSPEDAGSGNGGEGACGPDNCSGCCASDGTCVTSPTPQACGSKGHACQTCTADQLCSSGTCACPGSTHACGNACIDYSTSKDNCGSCGNACEGYQFCDGGKCLPHYVSTQVLPVTSGGDLVAVGSAAVFTDGAADDLLLQLSGDLVLSAPGAFITAELHGAGLARYTPDGTLVWSRSMVQLFGDQSRTTGTSQPAILANGDFVVEYDKYDPANGPVAGTYALRVGRIGGHTGNLVWEAKYPSSESSPFGVGLLVALSASQKVLTFDPALTYTLGGTFCQTSDLGSSGVVTCPVDRNYMMAAAPGADGATLWSWGAYNDTVAVALNPWSTQTWQLTGNGRFSGGDGYILGARDDSTTGPWFTEGDYGVLMKLLVDSAGDLIVAFSAAGIVSFNGGQDLLPSGGSVLTKINHQTGRIVWKTAITALPDRLALAPANRIVTISEAASDSPETLDLYSGLDGLHLSSFSGASVDHYGAVAAGQTEMYLTGTVTTPSDFDPGAATDMLGATPGVFVSRFSFQ